MKDYVEFEGRVMRKARWMCEGQPPEFNIAPTVDAVRQVLAMGFDIVKHEPAERQPQRRERP